MLSQTPEDQYVKIGKINTRFRASGNEGTVVILIHGLGGFVENWSDNINVLAKHHRVYALDLAGFGRSDKTSILSSLSEGAQFIHNFMDVQNIDRASLVGHSMGGGVTLQYAIQFPDRIEKMVIIDSVGLGREINLLVRLISIPFLGEYLSRPSRGRTVQLLKAYIYDPALITDEFVELCYRMASLPGAQKCFLSCLRNGINYRGIRPALVRPITDNLTNIMTPTLIIWGKQDKIFPSSHAYLARERIPNAELYILDPCGHMPQIERPEDVNKLLLEFLAGKGKNQFLNNTNVHHKMK